MNTFFTKALICALIGAIIATGYTVNTTLMQAARVSVDPSTVAVRSVPDKARGVTCWITSKGGIDCVPDQWFMPPPADKAEPAANRSQARDL